MPISTLRTKDSARIRSVTDGDTKLFLLCFLGGNIEPKIISAFGLGIDLQDIEKARPHQLAKLFVQHIRAVSFALERGKTIMDITRPQTAQAGHVHVAELVNRSCRNHDYHGYTASNGGFRLAVRF